ncbi:MAG: NTP transferase domain-containing protein [Armatimonadetes bacterium]|nr:NTP transferase domain-containing protein [Armatimonadota bacterium]
MSSDSFQAIVLAAGRGSRMGSSIPKVLLPVCGRPILRYVLDILEDVGIQRPVVVVSPETGKAIRDEFGGTCTYAVQNEQLGSGHAVKCARSAADGYENILVMCGDSPLFQAKTVRLLMNTHVEQRATITLVSAVVSDPRGYGRILRDANGGIEAIVEEQVATEEEKRIREINGGCYAFDAAWLWRNIELIPQNPAGEYCLTEMVHIALTRGLKVCAVTAESEEVMGINTPDELLAAEVIMRRRRTGGCS